MIFLLHFPNAKLRSSSHWETKSYADEKKESIKRNKSLRDKQVEQEQQDGKNEAKTICKLAFGKVFSNCWLLGLSKVKELQCSRHLKPERTKHWRADKCCSGFRGRINTVGANRGSFIFKLVSPLDQLLGTAFLNLSKRLG